MIGFTARVSPISTRALVASTQVSSCPSSPISISTAPTPTSTHFFQSCRAIQNSVFCPSLSGFHFSFSRVSAARRRILRSGATRILVSGAIAGLPTCSSDFTAVFARFLSANAWMSTSTVSACLKSPSASRIALRLSYSAVLSSSNRPFNALSSPITPRVVIISSWMSFSF